MSEVLIAAIFAGLGGLVGAVGKVIVDVIRAKHEPDQADLELKDELQREKEKSDTAIATFTDFGKDIKKCVEDMKTEMNQRFEDINEKITDYKEETRNINKSELRHSITQIYYARKDEKALDLRTKDDLCSLYEAYNSIGGNSFAHELYEEMMNWDVK